MEEIMISNDTFYDKDYKRTFAHRDKYKLFSVSSDTSTLLPFYAELLEQVLGEKMKEYFQDFALSKKETEEIQSIFENEIDKTLPNRESTKPYHKKLEWKGKMYDLNVSIPSPNNRRIIDYLTIVEICKECLSENKSMYLTIEENSTSRIYEV
jgi:hypothetical protein